MQAHRDKKRQRGDKDASEYLECSKCLHRYSRFHRGGWNCGWLPRSEHRGPFPAPPEWSYRPEPREGESREDYVERYTRQVCPGYLVRLPQVVEASHAFAWFRQGALTERLDGEPVTTVLRDAIDVLGGAAAEVESHMLNSARKG